MIKTVPIGWAWRPLAIQPKGTNLGQAVILPGQAPPEPAPTSVDPTIWLLGAGVLIGGILYVMLGHKKMKWDKFFY